MDGRTTVAKLNRATLASDAVAAVRAMLLDPVRYQPGQKISVEEMARELGVSRSPVWTAITRLEAEGLLIVSPRQGVFLVGYDLVTLKALFEAREALEGMATRLAAARSTEDQRRSIEDASAAAGAFLQRRDLEGYAAAALDFHIAVAAAASSPAIERQLAMIYARTAAMCRGRLPVRKTNDLAKNQAQHRGIAKAIQAHDPDAAERLGREHVVRLWAGLQL